MAPPNIGLEITYLFPDVLVSLPLEYKGEDFASRSSLHTYNQLRDQHVTNSQLLLMKEEGIMMSQ